MLLGYTPLKTQIGNTEKELVNSGRLKLNAPLQRSGMEEETDGTGAEVGSGGSSKDRCRKGQQATIIGRVSDARKPKYQHSAYSGSTQQLCWPLQVVTTRS